ncbi:MAG: T9SS type A sorting domain-containing protein [Crocinitomicaceae bacterium]
MMKSLLLSCISLLFFGGLYSQINSFPYVEDFEMEGQGPTFGCPLSYTMVAPGWTNLTTDGTDWSADVGGTGSFSTGPSVDHNPGTGTGHYLYTEASSCLSTSAVLLSPEFDLSGIGAATAADMSVWYHMYGSSMGTLTIAITTDGGVTWTDLTTLTDNLDLWQEYTLDVMPYAGSTIQFRFTGLTGTNYYSDMALDNFSIVTQFTDDIGAISVDSPSNPISTGVQFVTASIYNYGTNTVSTADVNWSVNGLVQTPINYTGTLAPGGTEAGLVLGAYDFQLGMTDVCVWTSLPNGNADAQPTNDSICVSLCTGLTGTYTIGGGTPDYTTFSDAVNDLIQCGISGPVVFDVAVGVYNENIILPPIVGASATNTITFNGASAATTVLTHDASQNATVWLQGGDHISFSNMTIETTGISDAWCVFLSDIAEYNTVSNCNLTMPVGAYTDVAGVVASADILDDFTEGNNANYCTFDNNVISGGERGFAFEGETAFASWMRGITVTNNHIYNIQDYGIYCDNQDSLIFSNNVVDSILNNLGDGVYCFDIVNFTFEGNTINAPDYGLYISDGNFNGDGAPSGMSNIINNMVSSSTDYGFYFNDVEMVNIWHNSVYTEATTSPACYAFDLIDCDVRNNIFYGGTDYAFETNADIVTNNNAFNYNSYFTNGPTLIRENLNDYVDLVAWQTAQPSQNVNSVEMDPDFFGPNDLHIISPLFDDLGSSVGIAVDIDGELRPQGVNVDIGADEYTSLDDDAVLLSIAQPKGLTCGDSAYEVKVVLSNNGGNPITSLPVEVNITGVVTTTLNATYTGTLNYSDVDTFVVGTIDTYNGGAITMTAYTQYPGDQNTSNDTIYNATADFIPFEPSGGSYPSCGFDYTTLYGDSSYVSLFEWWDAASGGTMVGTGTTFDVPSITTQDTYYLQYASGGVDSLETTFAGGNGCGGGAMFDISSVGTENLTALRVNSGVAAGTSIPVTVHYRTGTYVGSETNAAAWTTEGTYNIASGGAGLPSELITLNTPITIPSGQTIAIYVEYDAQYTNGANTYTDGSITITTGVGLCSPFGGVNDPRSFNGRLYFGADPCSAIRIPIQAIQTAPADVNLGPDSTACEQNGDVILNPGSGLTDHLWSPSGNTGATETVTSNGQYSVTATDADGCTNSDTIVVFFVDCLGIDEYNGLSGVNIFPNPSTGQFELQATLESGVTIEAIEIRSLDGKLIQSAQAKVNNNYITESFDLSKEESGVYFIRILTSEGLSVQRITIK